MIVRPEFTTEKRWSRGKGTRKRDVVDGAVLAIFFFLLLFFCPTLQLSQTASKVECFMGIRCYGEGVLSTAFGWLQ